MTDNPAEFFFTQNELSHGVASQTYITTPHLKNQVSPIYLDMTFLWDDAAIARKTWASWHWVLYRYLVFSIV